jgi:hypothetical protein
MSAFSLSFKRIFAFLPNILPLFSFSTINLQIEFVPLQQVSAYRRDTTLLRQSLSLSGGAGMIFEGKTITTIAVIRRM